MTTDVWQWLSEHLWAPLLAMITVWWTMLQHRISKAEKVADGSVSREEFMGYVARTDKRLDELRGDIGRIFDLFREHDRDDRTRHDQLTRMLHDNHAEMLNHMIKRS